MKIFISYRHADTGTMAGRIYDRLVEVFESNNVFQDKENLRGGANFKEEILDALNNADIVLVCIGNDWLTVTRDKRKTPRIREANDLVRREIEISLSRRSTVTVIPLLINGAHMPQRRELPVEIAELADQHALPVRDSDFHHDLEKIINVIQRPKQPKIDRNRRSLSLSFWLVMLLFSIAVIAIVSKGMNPNPIEPEQPLALNLALQFLVDTSAGMSFPLQLGGVESRYDITIDMISRVITRRKGAGTDDWISIRTAGGGDYSSSDKCSKTQNQISGMSYELTRERIESKLKPIQPANNTAYAEGLNKSLREDLKTSKAENSQAKLFFIFINSDQVSPACKDDDVLDVDFLLGEYARQNITAHFCAFTFFDNLGKYEAYRKRLADAGFECVENIEDAEDKDSTVDFILEQIEDVSLKVAALQTTTATPVSSEIEFELYTPTPTDTPSPTGTHEPFSEVRAGAGLQYEIIATYPNELALTPLAILEDETWLQIALLDGSEGWISWASTLSGGVNLDGLPVIPGNTPRPTNTPTPTFTSTFTLTATASSTATNTLTATDNPTGVPVSPTNTPTSTSSFTPTSTLTETPSLTASNTLTATNNSIEIPTQSEVVTNKLTDTPTQSKIVLELRTDDILYLENEAIVEVIITCPQQDCTFITAEIQFDPALIRVDADRILVGNYFGNNDFDRSTFSLVRSKTDNPEKQVIQFSISKRNQDFIPEVEGILFTFTAIGLKEGTNTLVFTDQTIVSTTRDVVPLRVDAEIQIVPLPTATPDIRIVAAQSVDVYSAPSVDTSIVGNFPVDTEFFVLGRIPDTAWMYLQLPDGSKGWVEAKLINFAPSIGNLAEVAPLTPTFTPTITPSLTPSITPSHTPIPEKIVNITANNINIRSEPRIGSDIISGVNAGVSFAVLEEIQDEDGIIWYKIDMNGVEGYVRQDVVEVARILPDGTPEIISTANGASSCPRLWSINQTLRIKPPSGAVDVFLRQTASGTDNRFVKIQNNQSVTVIGGPVRNNQCWWRVRTVGLTPTVEGWVEDGTLRLP